MFEACKRVLKHILVRNLSYKAYFILQFCDKFTSATTLFS